MASIEIPAPDLRIEYEHDEFDWLANERDVKFTLVFGGYKVAERVYGIPDPDYDNCHFDDRRDDFCEYVAERLERLFT